MSKEGLKRAINKEKRSLENCLNVELPHQEGRVNEILNSLENGEEATDRKLRNATISKAIANSALLSYPYSEEIKTYASRINIAYKKIVEYFPRAPK